jgi:hypothetical protein
MELSKIRKQFFNFNFFRSILSIRQVRFLKSAYNSRFFDTLYNLFHEKKISPLRRAVFKFFDIRTKKDRNAKNYRKMPLLKQSYIFFRKNLRFPVFRQAVVKKVLIDFLNPII